MRRSGHADNCAELLKRVAHNLRVRCDVAAGSHLLVGVSGGRDSVALLHVLARLARDHALTLSVAHFDHRLRSESADDARFVEQLAMHLELDVCVGAWDHPEPGEDAARRARHAFFARTARRRGCSVIALAHQLEDQIETVLMRLGRGTGPRGFPGMAWRRGGDVDIVRPLLDCRRELLASFLRRIGQEWREDSSNDDTTRTRNRVRRAVLPALESALGNDALEAWADSLDDLRAVWDHSSDAAAQLLLQVRRRTPFGENGSVELCDVLPFRDAPPAVRAAALQLWFESMGCRNLRRQHIRSAADLIQNGQSGHHVGLPGDMRLTLEQDTVIVRTPESGRDVIKSAAQHEAVVQRSSKSSETVSLRAPAPGDLVIETVRVVPSRAQILEESNRAVAPDALPAELIAWVDAGAAELDTWIVRAAEPGERVRLLGAPGSRKLARIFQDCRVPERLRAAWPVVADVEGVVWVPGIGVAERVRIRSGTRRAARLTLRRPRSAD